MSQHVERNSSLVYDFEKGKEERQRQSSEKHALLMYLFAPSW